jgi:hypothetical protein
METLLPGFCVSHLNTMLLLHKSSARPAAIRGQKVSCAVKSGSARDRHLRKARPKLGWASLFCPLDSTTRKTRSDSVPALYLEYLFNVLKLTHSSCHSCGSRNDKVRYVTIKYLLVTASYRKIGQFE